MTAAVAEKVEESLGTPLPVRLSRIKRFEGQPRRYFPQASLNALADSLQNDGQEHPVELNTIPGEPGMFELIDGERRWRAFHIVFERTGKEPLVDSIIKVVKDRKEHYRKSMLANMHREDLVPLDEAAAYHQLKLDGESIEDLMRIRGKSRTYIENYLKLHTLPEKVKELMDPDRPKEKQLSVTQAIDIARGIPESAPELRITLAEEAVERNLGTQDTRSLIEHRSRGTGYRPGGRLRKPSDDYKVFTSFLGRTRTTARRLLEDLDIDELYLYRDDDKSDRKKDLAEIDAILSMMQKFKERVQK